MELSYIALSRQQVKSWTQCFCQSMPLLLWYNLTYGNCGFVRCQKYTINTYKKNQNENQSIKYQAQICYLYLEHFKNWGGGKAHLSCKEKQKWHPPHFLSVTGKEPDEEQMLGRSHSLWGQLLWTSWGKRLHKQPYLPVLQWTGILCLSPWATNPTVLMKVSSNTWHNQDSLASWLCYCLS